MDREHRTAAFGTALAYASRFSHRCFQQLPTQRYGLRWLPVYLLSPRPEPGLGWDWGQTPELFRSVSHAPGSHPFGTAHVHEFRLPMIEPGTFLAAMLDAFRIAGGVVVIRALRDPTELLTLPEDVIVNCTGLGARELAGDPSLVPVRGQLRVLAPQPALDYAVIELTTGLHLFPRPDGVLLGGTSEPGVWSLTPDPAVAERLLARHQRLFRVAGLESSTRDGAA
ncbi:MAG: FAD-dependent oxidoreductase [Gammaproteobacteria bacterium]|nr:FAD-dependent oxidoreductase [Gammaproteobacteria bacterium]